MTHALDSVVNESIQPLLKTRGFKKKGLLWNRSRDCLIDVVTLQEAKYSTEDSVVLTLNLGIFVPSFFEAVWNKPSSVFVSEADCIVRVRLGDLIQDKPHGDALDKWWTLPDAMSEESTRDDILEALKSKGIPFLDSFDNFQTIAEHMRQVKGWQSKNPLMVIYRALAEWKSGETSSALQLLDHVKEKNWVSKASAVAVLIRSAASAKDEPLVF